MKSNPSPVTGKNDNKELEKRILAELSKVTHGRDDKLQLTKSAERIPGDAGAEWKMSDNYQECRSASAEQGSFVDRSSSRPPSPLWFSLGANARETHTLALSRQSAPCACECAHFSANFDNAVVGLASTRRHLRVRANSRSVAA